MYISETVETVSAYSVQRAVSARFFHLRILVLPAGVFRNFWKTFLLPFVFLRSEIFSLVLSTWMKASEVKVGLMKTSEVKVESRKQL